MLPPEPYNKLVRELFQNSDHAGDLGCSYAQEFAIAVAESGQGAQIALSAGIEDGIIREMRFRVWGCPHLIAAAQWLCARLESGPAAAMADFPLEEIMRQLSVPVEKTGRILLLEDALKSLMLQNSRTD